MRLLQNFRRLELTSFTWLLAPGYPAQVTIDSVCFRHSLPTPIPHPPSPHQLGQGCLRLRSGKEQRPCRPGSGFHLQNCTMLLLLLSPRTIGSTTTEPGTGSRPQSNDNKPKTRKPPWSLPTPRAHCCGDRRLRAELVWHQAGAWRYPLGQ